MARDLSGTMDDILAAGKRDIDWTIDITADDDEFHFATSPLTAVNDNDYTNDLETVSQIRQTLEGPTDQVSIGIQNKDRVLGQHVADNLDKWRKANAVVGRNYYEMGDDGVRTGTSEWFEMFRGAVQQPNVDDLQVTFDIVPDTVSPGQIVCSRTEAPACPFVFKDPRTCAYAGVETLCDHHLKSSGGCDGRNNSEHFGGTEHRYNPDAAPPGTGGNDGSGGGGFGDLGGGGGGDLGGGGGGGHFLPY